MDYNRQHLWLCCIFVCFYLIAPHEYDSVRNAILNWWPTQKIHQCSCCLVLGSIVFNWKHLPAASGKTKTSQTSAKMSVVIFFFTWQQSLVLLSYGGKAVKKVPYVLFVKMCVCVRIKNMSDWNFEESTSAYLFCRLYPTNESFRDTSMSKQGKNCVCVFVSMKSNFQTY